MIEGNIGPLNTSLWPTKKKWSAPVSLLRQTCTGVAAWATMQVVGGGGSGLPVSGAGVLTGGADVDTTSVLTGSGSVGISGALVGWESNPDGDGPEPDMVGGSTGVGVCVKVGVDVGLWVGLLVGLCFGCTGRFTTELPGVSVAVGEGVAVGAGVSIGVAVGEGVAVGVGVSVGVAVGGTPSTVKRIALFATTVSVSPILAITSALIVYPDSPRSGHDPDILKVITIRLPSLFGVIDLLLGQLLP